MKLQISGFLLIGCVLSLLSNHYWIDWERYAIKRAEDNLFQVIKEQRSDLEKWRSGKNTENLYRKRTLCQGRLEIWSDDHPFDYNLSIDSIGVIENDHGVFLFQTIQDADCEYISAYPLYQFYEISNQYLKEKRGGKLTHHIKGISKSADCSFEGLLRYNIKPRPNPVIDGILGFLILLIIIIEYIRFSKISFVSFLIATFVFVFLRIISLYFEALDLLFRFFLFDPINFTSSFFNPTIGDLLVNAIFILILTIFLTKYRMQFPKRYGRFCLIGLCIGLSLLIFHVPWSILNNSQISLDVGESIQFTFLRVVAYSCILIITTAYFVFVFYLLSYLKFINYLKSAGAISTIASLLVLVFNPLLALPVFVIAALFFSSLKVSWGIFLGDFNYSNLLFILIVAVSIGGILSFFIYKHGERDELFAKRIFANYLLLKRDVLGEYYLSQSVTELSNDANLMIIASEGSRENLEERILDEFVSSYFGKYNIELLFQDYQRLKVNTRFTRENGLLKPDNASDYENIHFIDEGTSFKYVAKLNIGDLVALVIFRIKKRVPTTVYPALLTDSKFNIASDDFDYAVFAGNEILFHRSKFGQGEWLQEEDFENKKLYDKGIEKNGRHYYGVETNDGRIILIISQKYPVRSMFANFCFLFLLLLFSFSLYCGLLSVYLSHNYTLNFTSKIQTYLSITFIAPLLTTGFALLTTLNTSYKEEINRSYLKQALYISEILSEKLEKETEDHIRSELLAEIGDFTQSDISFYNSSGYLVSTSQPDIFSLGLQSNLINPVVFDKLVAKENQSMIADESIGALEYKVCYAVVNALSNEIAGFIAMPFFDSKSHLQKQQIDIFGNLIIIFGFIFILAILVGNVVLNNLLHPLRMVAGKIRQITLQDVNQPIQYESSDEIGSLVKDYNQMLIKLEDSKRALARSQKETAWKEIAKQVAHEIKNPLTPMQLKIQQLLRRYDKDTKEYDALSSLLTQVDTLSQIAESFSAFAEMPAPDNQIFQWGELVEEVSRLYRSDKVIIEVDCEENVSIEADKDIFRRILNNIVLNAIQSVRNGEPKIEIKLNRKPDKSILSVKDNGKGIPDNLKDKIFLNYFSTKSTGSGIGLALAKKGIENAGGNVWFESVQNEGTTFYLSMPLVTRS
ncbi:MAG: ATP-binding protein [Bacteroidota bacterium]